MALVYQRESVVSAPVRFSSFEAKTALMATLEFLKRRSGVPLHVRILSAHGEVPPLELSPELLLAGIEGLFDEE